MATHTYCTAVLHLNTDHYAIAAFLTFQSALGFLSSSHLTCASLWAGCTVSETSNVALQVITPAVLLPPLLYLHLSLNILNLVWKIYRLGVWLEVSLTDEAAVFNGFCLLALWIFIIVKYSFPFFIVPPFLLFNMTVVFFSSFHEKRKISF